MMITQIKKELEALVVQMISALHLIWIIPLCIIAGMVVLGFIVGASNNSKEYEIYQEGIKEGYNKAMKGKHK